MDAGSSCPRGLGGCRDAIEAFHLKIAAIAAILIACAVGVFMSIVGKSHPAFRAESNLFFVIKAFAAGVILATGFVHMLPDAFLALNNPCLPEFPWRGFPFAGFVAMITALFTLLLDFWVTTYYERRLAASEQSTTHSATTDFTTGKREAIGKNKSICSDDEGKGNGLTSVAVPVHPSAHNHNHGHHSHHRSEDSDENSRLRQKVISQVLELGIVAHSFIISIPVGASQSPCTIRPLIAALTFHQFFEGIALGGCIAHAGFGTRSAALMSCFFSVTAPAGIGIGIGISSIYNESSHKTLIVEGLLDSMSAGILVYTSLVNLIAIDFMSKRLQGNMKLQLLSYVSLFLGSGAMSVIARWS